MIPSRIALNTNFVPASAQMRKRMAVFFTKITDAIVSIAEESGVAMVGGYCFVPLEESVLGPWVYLSRLCCEAASKFGCFI
jgi:hypothetical protein